MQPKEEPITLYIKTEKEDIAIKGEPISITLYMNTDTGCSSSKEEPITVILYHRKRDRISGSDLSNLTFLALGGF